MYFFNWVNEQLEIFWSSVTSGRRRALIKTCDKKRDSIYSIFLKSAFNELLSDSLARSLAELWPKFGSNVTTADLAVFIFQ